jgi:hypothetical protein
LLVDLAVPHILPDNVLTAAVGVYIVRNDKEAFSEVLKLRNAIYFSIVTMTTGTYLPSPDRQDF